ncbi:SusC/RagA family TonB-linked outer membrane protein [Flavobacterium subsaxonicum]|uniref:TonB-dependent receptor n=1 Tax=Flavobacterium subsaxonicum WB 4.1-42 = DSM 21790 TaxID=1121898 RepID=A0A0A2MYJ5_9FLAO|nr:SusC/RagA family TonB-linked outer membrane protein [Flavobacterium subsaxonicum]KGO93290.1 TonB-dependent receptor [Flavobacterium subsaxonicum WB 4.1-42 = DSM 21790]
MKTKLKVLLALLVMLTAQISFAQERTVTGTVSDESGFPIPGVNVVVKGTTVSAQTDIDGKFAVAATATQVLVFSYVGMQTQEASASAGSVSITLKDAATELEGVVVTALGISRDKKSLGYSSQKIDGSAVNTVPTNNFINNLSGKVAGLEIRNNSNFGGSTNIVLRGTKSITGNNQALIVLDGVPISNSNLNTTDAANSRNGFDYGNSTSDIDPNNIESVTVLKGAAATALYGSQASNGAIMITTKKGKTNSGLGVTFSSTTSVGRYNKDTFVKYQKQYGANGYGGGNDSFSNVDVNGDGVDDLLVDTTADASYGNAFDPNLSVYQWNAFAPGSANFGRATPWKAADNDPGAFFQDSFGAQNSITASGGDEKTTYSFGFSNNYETGILPNSQLNKNNINSNFTHQLSKKVKLTAFANFTDQTTKGRNNVGYGDNILGSFRQWWQTNVDVKELRDVYNATGQNITWNMSDPVGGDLAPLYWDNPYFSRYRNYQSDDHNRLLTGGNISYDVTDDFNILGRVTVDSSNDRQEMRKEVGSVAAEFGLSALDETSGYRLFTRNFLQTTYDFILNYDFQMGKVGGHALAGTTYIKSKLDSFDGSTTGGLVAPGLFTLANSNSFVAPAEAEINYEKQGFYGQLSLDYNKWIYIEGSYRNDVSTALSINNRSYDYYSIGGSLILSEFIKQDWLSLLKLRGSYAIVGNDPVAGRLGARVNNSILDGNLLFGNSTTYVDFESLKPEKQKATEVGLEASMFNSRLALDVALYKTNTTDQLFNVPQSTATGYSFSQVNAGELQNKGIEVSLSGTPIKTNDFSWDVRVNWSKNKNEMVSLNQGRENLQLATFQDGVSLNATVGQPYGTLRGTGYVFDANGNKVVDEDGYYLTESDQVIGNIQADWIGGVYNKFTYKNISLSVLIDVKHGGDVFSLDQAYGLYTGLYPETAGNNDLGNPKRNSVADGGGIILPGVYEDGTPNTSRIEANGVGSAYGTNSGPNQAFVYDASYVKLREVGLSYSFPSKVLEKTAFSNLSLSFLGNNLWIIHKNLPYADPEAGASAGNVQGYQSGVMPSTKVYSINLKASF